MSNAHTDSDIESGPPRARQQQKGRSEGHDEEPHRSASLRKPKCAFGNPGPLGLAAFATTTFVLSCFNTGLVGNGDAVVLGLALYFGGAVQMIAGIWEFICSNTFGATAFLSYGGFWMAFATLASTKFAPADVPNAIGLFLLAWTILTGLYMVVSFKVSPSLFSLFVALEITFILLTAGAFAGSAGTTHAGGWFGIITAGIAWYCSFGQLLNTVWGGNIVPL